MTSIVLSQCTVKQESFSTTVAFIQLLMSTAVFMILPGTGGGK